MRAQSGYGALVAIVVAAVLILGAASYFGVLHLGSAVPVPSSGVTLLGLQNVAILSNFAGFQGPWWIATAVIGGTQSINVQGLGHASASTLAAANSSYVCGASCQTNNVNFTVEKSYLQYNIQSQGVPVDVYNLTYLSSPATLSFQGCIGANPISLVKDTVPTSTTTSFSGCAGNHVTSQTNYVAACKAQGGKALYSGPYEQPALDNNYATNVYTYVGCYQLNAIPYAYVYSLNSAIPQYTVKVSLNGQSSSISNNQTVNTTNSNILLFNIGSGFVSQDAPSQQLASVITWAKNGTSALESSVLTSQVSSELAQINTQVGTATTLTAATGSIAVGNQAISHLFVNDTANGQFAGAYLLAGKYVLIQDPHQQYIRPNIEMAFKATSVGLYLGVSEMNITSIQVPAFRSGSTATIYVQIKNIGSAQGGYTLTGQGANDNFVPTQQTGTLSAGQQQTVSFTLQNNDQITSNTIQGGSFTVCNLANQCMTKSFSYTLVPSCNQNQVFNAGTCETLTTIPAPTTTIPGGNGTATTTILPCNTQTGANCPAPPPAPTGTPLWEIVLVIIVIIVIVIAAYAYIKSTEK